MNTEWVSYRTAQERLGCGKRQMQVLVASGAVKRRFEALPDGKSVERYLRTDIERVWPKLQLEKADVPLKAWLTLAEAALCGLPRSLLLRLVREGKIVGDKGGPGGSWRILRKSLEAFEG